VRRNQAHIKNADLRHPSCTVVMYRRKSASPVHNVLKLSSCQILLDTLLGTNWTSEQELSKDCMLLL